MKKIEKSFWITNISNKNVSLSDLNLTIKAMSSVNLLDKKHYYLTEEQLENSFTSGSLFKKRDKLFKRIIPPPGIKEHKIQVDANSSISSKQKSVFEIKIQEYEELKVADDKEDQLNQEFEYIANNFVADTD